jgi:hypothetical protein
MPACRVCASATAITCGAGFTEIGTLWQRGGNRLLAAVR